MHDCWLLLLNTTTQFCIAFQVALRKKKYIGICGQAPSDFPEFASFLVEQGELTTPLLGVLVLMLLVLLGIESISLTPDTVLATTLRLAETEKAVAAKKAETEKAAGAKKQSERPEQHGSAKTPVTQAN
jgi:hypothetical protein